MAVLTFQKTMLYCPKCRAAYEEGTQRFCTHDGVRLLPDFSQGKTGLPASGVFTKIFNRNFPHAEKKSDATLSYADSVEKQSVTVFEPLAESEILEIEQIPEVKESPEIKENSEVEEIKPATEPKKPEQASKPLPRLIRPNEIALSQAKLGDRSVNPTGRVALTWENTEILIGQAIKGRYHIVEQLSEDELSVAYLAEDKIVKGRKAVVRVLMVEKDADDYLNKIFAEERVSLSHINHPNVTHLFDSGVLPEGKIFIVTEYIEGESLKEKLIHSGAFSPVHTARIIRQVANALSEVHQNGILHRNLKPQNIILGVSESGIQQVKVTDFAVYDGFEEQTQENIKYLSPEQLEGKMPTFASDIYSLAVIAYQMLTGRLPFNHSTEKELLKAQKEGLSLLPTNLRLDLSRQVDEILKRALNYKPSARFPNARDFGDAFYNSLTTSPAWEKSAVEISSEEEKTPVFTSEKILNISNEKIPLVSNEDLKQVNEDLDQDKEILSIESLPVFEKDEFSEAENLETVSDKKAEEVKTTKVSQELAWEKRSPEPLQTASSTRIIAFVLGLILLGAGTWAIWNYFSKQQNLPAYVPQNKTEIAGAGNNDQNQNAAAPVTNQPKVGQVEKTPMEIESPPLPRQITAPPNYVYFQNSKEKLTGDLAKNFRAFSLYYPNDWAKGESQTNFVDIARVGATGTPIEQMLVSYFDSKGTLAADLEKFPKLIQQSNQYFSKQFPNYRLVSEGETKINGEWKAYEIKFRGEGKTKNGDYVTIWGRRLWIPAARQGVSSGFVITMLATSVSPEVKGVDDVGVKGELATILETFEPASLDATF